MSKPVTFSQLKPPIKEFATVTGQLTKQALNNTVTWIKNNKNEIGIALIVAGIAIALIGITCTVSSGMILNKLHGFKVLGFFGVTNAGGCNFLLVKTSYLTRIFHKILYASIAATVFGSYAIATGTALKLLKNK